MRFGSNRKEREREREREASIGHGKHLTRARLGGWGRKQGRKRGEDAEREKQSMLHQTRLSKIRWGKCSEIMYL